MLSSYRDVDENAVWMISHIIIFLRSCCSHYSFLPPLSSKHLFIFCHHCN